ncbi:MAG: tetratricopeptide repeat protein [Candidatus Aminicenantes bacterium]|nr:tetratricopeptide repeat protein [Candidatus Aminicenantes bacterium]
MPADKDKAKKDLYEKTVASYGQAAKAFRRGDCQKAKEYFEAFVEKFPNEKELVDRAQIYLKICRDKGKKDTIPLQTFEDYYEMGVYRMNQGDYEEALKLFKKALDKNPDTGKILYLIGKTNYKIGQNEEFFVNLKAAIQKDSSIRVFAQNDPDIEELKEDKKFKVITKLA